MGGRTIVVGTKIAPPFAFQAQDGSWKGITIELWKEIAQRLDLAYTFQDFDLQGLISALERGTLDVAAAALTTTAEREKRFDFSHPFHTTGLAIAVSVDDSAGWLSTVSSFLSWAFLKAVITLSLVLLVFGVLVWFFERKHNQEQFGRGLQGIAAAFWWSAVTMTTVGYGDKAPKTPGGRVVAMVWMFAAVIIISSFTAAITSSLTMNRMRASIKGPQDLVRYRVATVPGSTSEAYLRGLHVALFPVASVQEGLEAVAAGQVKAMVYDAPILKYMAVSQFRTTIKVLPFTFSRQDYALGFPPGSRLREPVNRVLLEIINSELWTRILSSYLGEH